GQEVLAAPPRVAAWPAPPPDLQASQRPPARPPANPPRRDDPAMLTIFGRKNPYCDGISRRSFLSIGALGLGATALHLTDIFRAEARAGVTGLQHKAVINIFLGGGPPHQDMWDLKMAAPAEIRGEFKPIATSVSGIQIGECFPRIARMADKCAFIRSIVGATGGHDAVQCMSGWTMRDMKDMGGRPS